MEILIQKILTSMAAPKAVLGVLLVSALYLAQAPATTTADRTDIHKLSVFSSLQHEKPVNGYLAPYPAGVELVLTCNMRAVVKPQWWEWDNLLCPNSTTNSDTGINTVKFHISKLSPRDHARRLTCASDNQVVEPVTVAIYVISDIPELQISYSTNNNKMSAPVTNQTSIHLMSKKTSLTCGARGLDRHLNLCWFKDNKEIGCQSKYKSKISNLSPVSITVSKDDIGSVLVCKPKLRDGGEVLVPSVLEVFEEQFENSKHEVTILHTDDAERADTLLQNGTSQPLEGTGNRKHPCVNPSCDTTCVAAEVLPVLNYEDEPEEGFLIATFRSFGTGTPQQNKETNWQYNQDLTKPTENSMSNRSIKRSTEKRSPEVMNVELVDQKQREGTVAALTLVLGALIVIILLLIFLAVLQYRKPREGGQKRKNDGSFSNESFPGADKGETNGLFTPSNDQ